MKDSLVFLDIQWGQQSSCGLGDVYVFRLGDENILLTAAHALYVESSSSS